MVNYNVKQKSIITWRHDGFPSVKMEHLFVRVFKGSPKFWLTGGDVFNKQQRLHDAIGFNKIVSWFVQGGFARALAGLKMEVLFPQKKP